MNVVRAVVAVVAVFAGMYLAQSVTVKLKEPVAVEAPPYVPLRRFSPFHGVAIQLAADYKAVERYGELVRQVAGLGADSVMLTLDVYQEHAGSGSVKVDPEHIPSREDVLTILRIAHEADLRVILMPKVLLSAPRGNEWRGVIQPGDWDQWFASYTEFLDYVADIAREGKAEVLMVGSELVSTEKYTDRWNAIIARMRKKFTGLLGYSANWDHYKNIEFWKHLDLVGLTTYHKLADEGCPPLDKIVETWRPIKQELLEWQATIEKPTGPPPLFFTEVGWCSQEGAAEFPWNYYHKQEATAAGHEEQRRCYVAFMKTWQDAKQVGGTIWWEWTESPGGKDDYNYTPKGKPAERELRRWFRDVRLRRAYPASRKSDQG